MISARLYAELGEIDAALAEARVVEEIVANHAVYGFSSIGWHLAVIYALSGEETTASHYAARAAKAFVDDAMGMNAAAAEFFSRLPWHRELFAFLGGRGLPKSAREAGVVVTAPAGFQ